MLQPKLLSVLGAKLLFGVVCVAVSGIAGGGASATTITFGGLNGANEDPFTTYTESGFTVSPTLGTWFQGQLFGNPAPSIFSGPVSGSPATDAVTVTEGGQKFTFSQLDLAANNGNVNFTFTGRCLTRRSSTSPAPSLKIPLSSRPS
jgi:hypothetical protein